MLEYKVPKGSYWLYGLSFTFLALFATLLVGAILNSKNPINATSLVLFATLEAAYFLYLRAAYRLDEGVRVIEDRLELRFIRASQTIRIVDIVAIAIHRGVGEGFDYNWVEVLLKNGEKVKVPGRIELAPFFVQLAQTYNINCAFLK